MSKKQKFKKLEEMVKEEWEQPIEPAFEVKYKDLVFTAYKNSFYDDRPMLSCYISRNGRMLEHSGRTQYFTEEKALEELKWKYAAYLEMEVIKLLKEKGNAILVAPDMYNDPHIVVRFDYDNAEEWEKVKEYFEL